MSFIITIEFAQKESDSAILRGECTWLWGVGLEITTIQLCLVAHARTFLVLPRAVLGDLRGAAVNRIDVVGDGARLGLTLEIRARCVLLGVCDGGLGCDCVSRHDVIGDGNGLILIRAIGPRRVLLGMSLGVLGLGRVRRHDVVGDGGGLGPGHVVLAVDLPFMRAGSPGGKRGV